MACNEDKELDGKELVAEDEKEVKMEAVKEISKQEAGEADAAVQKGAEEENQEVIKTEVEPKTGAAFPAKLQDGKQLNALGIRKKKILSISLNIYAFGIYGDNDKLQELVREKQLAGEAAPDDRNPSKELYEAAIDSELGLTVRLNIVFRGLTMSLVRKSFDEGLGASIKKLNGGQKNDDLVKRVMGEASDSIKLPPGSVIEITRLPGYILQTKVKDKVVSMVQSELLCKAYFNMYLGDDPFDAEAKAKFGAALLCMT